MSSVYCPKVVGTSNLFNMSSGWGADTRFRKTDIEQFPGGQKHSQTPDGQYWKHLQVSYIVKDQTSFENARDVPCLTLFFLSSPSPSRSSGPSAKSTLGLMSNSFSFQFDFFLKNLYRENNFLFPYYQQLSREGLFELTLCPQRALYVLAL